MFPSLFFPSHHITSHHIPSHPIEGADMILISLVIPVHPLLLIRSYIMNLYHIYVFVLKCLHIAWHPNWTFNDICPAEGLLWSMGHGVDLQ